MQKWFHADGRGNASMKASPAPDTPNQRDRKRDSSAGARQDSTCKTRFTRNQIHSRDLAWPFSSEVPLVKQTQKQEQKQEYTGRQTEQRRLQEHDEQGNKRLLEQERNRRNLLGFRNNDSGKKVEQEATNWRRRTGSANWRRRSTSDDLTDVENAAPEEEAAAEGHEEDRNSPRSDLPTSENLRGDNETKQKQ